MKSFMKKTLALGTTVSLAVLTGCGSNNDDTAAASDEAGVCPAEVSFGLQSPYSAYVHEIALQEGFLDETGIESFQYTMFTSVPSMLTAVDGGQVMFGAQSIPALTSFNRQEGEQALVAFSVYGVSLSTASATKDSGVPTAEEAGWEETVQAWAGKTVGVPALGGIVHKELIHMMELAGLDPENDVEI